MFSFSCTGKEKCDKCFYLVKMEFQKKNRNKKTQGVENPAQESQYNKNLIEIACSVRTGKILKTNYQCSLTKGEYGYLPIPSLSLFLGKSSQYNDEK